jgi:hypothetical protein
LNDSKTGALSVKGAWWDAAAPDQRRFGELNVDQTGRVTLELEAIALRSREEMAGFDDDRLESRTFHGHDQYGNPYSLFGCVRAHTTRSVAYVMRREGVQIAVRGLHCNSPDEVMLDHVTVDFTDLQEWLCTPRLTRVEESAGRIVLQKPSEAEQIFPTTRGFSVVVRPFVGGSSSAEGESFSFEHSLDLRFDAPVNLRHLTEIIHDMQWFLTLGVGRPVGVESVSGTRKGFFAAGTEFPELIKIHQRWRGPADADRERHRWEMLFTAADLPQGIGVALDQWHTYRERHGPVLACYFSTLFNRHLYSNHEFLFLAHALELYHQLNFNGAYQDTAVFSARLDKIATGVPDEAEWLRQRLAGANRKTLADRLTELLVVKTSLLGNFISDPDQFVARIKDTRNYYTHYDASLHRKGRVAEGVDLLKLTNQMRAVLETCFLEDLGAPASAIKKVLRDERTYIAAP